MSPMMQTTRTYNYVEIKPGAQWAEPAMHLDFTLHVRCEAVQPDKFVGEVRIMGSTLFATEGRDSIEQAFAEAREALKARLIAVFTEPTD
jgi:hypothetical protein